MAYAQGIDHFLKAEAMNITDIKETMMTIPCSMPTCLATAQ